ncbi:sialic acid-binding Ig-like lectin 15 [Xiphias gladius]|uniref:sialic acid-binding Ig-like lectin 15 n=1 Tax=Xiphias gladius TaxID=8245 RepID=UPI001A982DF6|nr:sialic acid-binding Ig-like lectin 15 [Xiphias gladius]
MWQQTEFFFVILSVIIPGSLSVSWNMVVSGEVTVSRGEDAVLGCSFTHPRQQHYSGRITVKWLARVSDALPFFSCSVKNDSREEFSSCSSSGIKYSLDGDPRRGELSLLVKKVQLIDNGWFFCRVELDGQWDNFQKHVRLYVTGEPLILSLLVVETPSGSDSARRRLQCEVEGQPLPRVVWLSASRSLIENQVQTSQTGLYRLISSVPYPEEEALTCRAEGELGGAERTYPASDTLMITLTVCGVLLLLLLLLSTGVIKHLRRTRAENRRQRASASPADGEAENHLVYSAITLRSSTNAPPANFKRSTRQHEEPGVLYSSVNVQ